jgi:hypothetical protein
MKVKALTHRITSIFVCAIMLASFLPQATLAGDTKEKVQVKIGKPSVWSLAQAHYLLASMHKKNSKISITDIDPTDLDPNRANATRLQILRTVLGIQAEFNQKVGAENQAKLREDQVQVKRRADAQVELAAKEEELRAEKAELNGLKRRLAVLQATDTQREEERKAESDAGSKRDADGNITEQKFIPLTDEDKKRKEDIAKLQNRVTAHQDKVTALTGEVTALNNKANADITPPTLTDTTLTANTVSLPQFSTSMQRLIDNALNSAGKPSLAASIALDNYVGMQYEIIAKQLTLLRDEIGPDERVIFLELPSSIYTVPSKSEDYVVQVRWNVTDYYYDKKLRIKDNCKECPKESECNQESGDGFAHPPIRTFTKAMMEEKKVYEADKKKYTERMTLNRADLECISRWISSEDDSIRAIDIIPRQSALNVNDFHATVSQKNFLGVLKLLSGFGVKVDYQRQRELYEEFLQQEVFASGFGKGRQDFGWTFGPLPGTNRIAPGQRTTYAVLAVPRTASGISLEANAIAYKRTKTPMDEFTGVAVGTGQLLAKDSFMIAVPNEHTEGFDVRNVAYSPVQSGSSVTVVLDGEYFSPQVNVFVENTALTRVLNFGSGERKELAPEATSLNSKIKGFFEVVNSKELILTFDMGESFVGTPNITLVTPEKTSSINFYKMNINYHGESSLREISLTEPMFMKAFDLTAFDVRNDRTDSNYLLARLTGTGLRRKAEIWINDNPISYIDGPPPNPPGEYAMQESTDAYILRFLKGTGSVWNLRYRQKNIRGFDEKTIKQKFPADPAPYEIRHYISRADGTNAEVDMRFFNTDSGDVPKAEIAQIVVNRVEINGNEGTYPRVEGCTGRRRPAGSRPCGQFDENDSQYRARFLVFPHIVGSHKLDRDTITIAVYKDVTKKDGTIVPTKEVMDISLPVKPQISKVINPGNGKSSGYADQEETAIIEGVNLDAIKKIFFGSQQAEIVGVTDNDSAIVKVPKLANLPKGESLTVPITVEMKSDFYEGKTLTAGYYKYIGEPLPIDVGEPVPVIVRRPHNKPRHPGNN